MVTVYMTNLGLLLSSASIGDDGNVTSGDVVNGCWRYYGTATRHFCYSTYYDDDLLRPMHHFPRATHDTLVILPSGMLLQGYNSVIQWALQQPIDDLVSLRQRLLEIARIEANGARVRVPASWDDGIAF